MSRKTAYVDKAALLLAMIDYRAQVQRWKRTPHEEKPRVPEYVGECILKIAQHLSKKGNFVGYTYRDDMISEGVDNCLRYIDNFDPEKSENAFAYFTQIVYFAFLKHIAMEKKQSYIKHVLVDQAFSELGQTHSTTSVMIDFEEKLKKRSKRLRTRSKIEPLVVVYDCF